MSDVGIQEIIEFGSVDPAPAQDLHPTEQHRADLINEENRMFLRMRTVFAL